MTDATPAHLGGDVPMATWERELESIAEAPAAERHAAITALLSDLDEHVSAL